MKPTLLRRALPFAVLLLSACGDQGVTAYRVPKEIAAAPAAAANVPDAALPAGHPPTTSGAAPMADTAVATAGGAALTWVAPAHWVAKPPGGMRKGSYAVGGAAGVGADLAITAFPGDVGGEVANVNRWRGQLGLAPLPAAQVPAAITRLEANGLKIAVVDLTGTANGAPARLVGAMVPVGDATWFFKLLGPDAVVAKEQAAFLVFLQSVQPAAPTP